MSSIRAAASMFAEVDEGIWKACAGATVQVPVVGSLVYYFPEGHLEHANCPSNFVFSKETPAYILCRILAVNFLADDNTDEVFVKLLLHPLIPGYGKRGVHGMQGAEGIDHGVITQNDYRSENDVVCNDVASFAKVLTPSDANNGGGFSVPRFCADLIFPRLDFDADPPVQNLRIRDIHGNEWEFRHIYRGTPRRHLLTTGWSKFVNSKKLVAGDSVIFMRDKRNEQLHLGIRRTTRKHGGGGSADKWKCASIGAGTIEEKDLMDDHCEYWRSGTDKLAVKAVVEAVDKARQGLAFEVVLFPRAGGGDFVVKAEAVEASLCVSWSRGTKVKIALGSEDSSRVNWFQGTVSSITVPETGPWRGSPWKMLQITWDEPEVLQNFKRVSPWQVEYVAQRTSFQSVFHPSKKLKVLQSSGFICDEAGQGFLSLMRSGASAEEHLVPSLDDCKSFPAGMQGARQHEICLSSSFNLDNQCTLLDINMTPVSKALSTELNIGSSQSDSLSRDSQSSVHFSSPNVVPKRGLCGLRNADAGSIQLFGKIIYIQEPIECGDENVGCSKGETSEGYKRIDVKHDGSDCSDDILCVKLTDGQCQTT